MHGMNHVKVIIAQPARIIHQHKNTRGKLFKTNSVIGSIKRADSIVQLCTCCCHRRFNVFRLFTITQRDKHKLHTLFDPLSKRRTVTHRQ